MRLFCTNCGEKLGANVKFCPGCGAQVENGIPLPESPAGSGPMSNQLNDAVNGIKDKINGTSSTYLCVGISVLLAVLMFMKWIAIKIPTFGLFNTDSFGMSFSLPRVFSIVNEVKDLYGKDVPAVLDFMLVAFFILFALSLIFLVVFCIMLLSDSKSAARWGMNAMNAVLALSIAVIALIYLVNFAMANEYKEMEIIGDLFKLTLIPFITIAVALFGRLYAVKKL